MSNSEKTPKSRLRVFVISLVAFIVVVSALFPRLSTTGPKLTKRRWAEIHINGLGTALDMFKSENGYYPSGTNALDDLIVQPAGTTNLA